MFNVDVEFDGQDEKVSCSVGSREIYQWEKSGRGRSMSNLRSNLHMTEMYELAHIALTRQRLWSGSLAELAETADLDFRDAEDDADGAGDQTEDPTSAGA